MDGDVPFPMDLEDDQDDTDYYYENQSEETEPLRSEAESPSTEVQVRAQTPNSTDEDPEYFDYECLCSTDVERVLAECVHELCSSLQVTAFAAKILLKKFNFETTAIIERYRQDATRLLIESGIQPARTIAVDDEDINLPYVLQSDARAKVCLMCCGINVSSRFKALRCGHEYCSDCWSRYLELKISEDTGLGMECMACGLHIPEDFVLSTINQTEREKYQQLCFSDCIKAHPRLRYCPGTDCSIIVSANECQAKRVICKNCKETFCFKCGKEYHAPADCETIKRWITKCADDSETANYVSANTKDCPKCQLCIEKNGGCNHMQCDSCKFEFCWFCLEDWSTHGNDEYKCSRYRENPNIANQSALIQNTEALEKYMFYFEKWQNQKRSLCLEQQTHIKIFELTVEKTRNGVGTWIDWQYLRDATSLLAKCRRTLQFAYAYAYYMASGPEKVLFEQEQAKLEAVIEQLSWIVERAESTDREDIIHQMDVAEHSHTLLLKDFLQV